jgi:hypothetical protein
VTKRLWFDLTATLRVAEHATSCDTFAGYGDYGREPCLLIATGQRGGLDSNGRGDQPTPAPVRAIHVDGGEAERWDRLTPAVYLRLTHPDDGTDETLLDTLRHHAAGGARWFTVDADGGHADGRVCWAVRHTRDLPAEVTWVPSHVAAGELGPYPAQVAHGYHRDGAVHARFARDTVWWIALDLRSLPAGRRPAETLRVTGEHVERVEPVGRPGGDREPTAPLPHDPDGWWRIGGKGWPWTVVDEPLQPGGVYADLFVAWGPDGDRCTVCHAVDQLDHQAMPSMAGYGQDTSTRCRRCGSYETTDPIFGSHPHPAPWPPPPDQQATLDRQAMPDRQFDRHGSRDPRHAGNRRAKPDGQPRSDQPDQAGS